MFGQRKSEPSEAAVRPLEATEGTDRAYRQAWGFTALEWAALTPEQRRDYRDSVSYATGNRVGN